jgi:prostaglandin-H2 D-isomerase / glutathione transferase
MVKEGCIAPLIRRLSGAAYPTELVMPAMSQITLTYFDIPTSRGEEVRLALTLAGLPFTDERLKVEEFAKRKASTPFGALPVLTIEGKRPIAQSNAILRLIGSQHGLLPSDPHESARHEAVMGAVEDLRAKMGPINRIKDPEEKKRQREDLAANVLPEWAGHIEKQIDGPFLGGNEISVADLKLFVVLTPVLNGKIDHVPATVVAPFAKLMKLHEAVKTHPKVAGWYARSR